MLRTFRKGGIHPPEQKLSASKKIEKIPLPTTVTIPLSQHIGVPAIPVVKVRENVKVGQLLAKAIDGPPSANIHSPVSGKITKIDDILGSSGFKQKSFIIKVDDKDEWIETIDRSEELVKDIKLSSEEIIKKVAEAGIVGLGGATFPAHIKLNIRRGDKAEILIINGVECEPYLTADHRLMLEKGNELMVGIKILMKALNVDRAVIGIENNKKDAIKHLSKLSTEYSGIEIYALKVKYPQGAEKQLVKAVINRETPSGGLPIAVGAVVHNVGTAFAVYEAVQKNKSLFERVVTVTGKSLKEPKNILARIGTPFSALIDAAGGLPEDTAKIISGGPMMGKAVESVDASVTKGTSGILLIRDKEAKRRPMNACIRCAKCVSVCPMGLEPYLLMSLAQYDKFERVISEDVMDCVECGSCSYTCPSDRPLLDYIRLGKNKARMIMRNRK